MQMNNDVSVGSQKALSQGRVPMGISSLYVLKALCAFLVVCSHAPLFGVYGDYILAPFKTSAVPFFFVISGYFLYNSDHDKFYGRLLGSLKKVILLVVICNSVYYLWVFPNHGSIIKSWSQIVDLIFFGDRMIISLWYLTAFMWGLVLFLLCLRYIPRTYLGKDWLYYCLLPLGTLPVFATAYKEWTTSVLGFEYFYLNAVCYALPYLSLGFMIKKNEQWLVSRVRGYYCILALILLLGETYFILFLSGYIVDGPFFMTMPFVAVIFTLLLKNSEWGRGTYVEEVGRRYSANIYYWHLLMATVGRYFMRFVRLDEYYDFLQALIVFFLSLVVAIVIDKVQARLGISIL